MTPQARAADELARLTEELGLYDASRGAPPEGEDGSPPVTPVPLRTGQRVPVVPDEDPPPEPALPEIPEPEPLPGGVLGYNVGTKRTVGVGGWNASADWMSREEAEHVLKVTGGMLVEIRAVSP